MAGVSPRIKPPQVGGHPFGGVDAACLRVSAAVRAVEARSVRFVPGVVCWCGPNSALASIRGLRPLLTRGGVGRWWRVAVLWSGCRPGACGLSSAGAYQKPPQVGGHPVTAGADGLQRRECRTLRGEVPPGRCIESPLRSARTQGGLLVWAELRLSFDTRLRRYSPAAGGALRGYSPAAEWRWVLRRFSPRGGWPVPPAAYSSRAQEVVEGRTQQGVAGQAGAEGESRGVGAAVSGVGEAPRRARSPTHPDRCCRRRAPGGSGQDPPGIVLRGNHSRDRQPGSQVLVDLPRGHQAAPSRENTSTSHCA